MFTSCNMPIPIHVQVCRRSNAYEHVAPTETTMFFCAPCISMKLPCWDLPFIFPSSRNCHRKGDTPKAPCFVVVQVLQVTWPTGECSELPDTLCHGFMGRYADECRTFGAWAAFNELIDGDSREEPPGVGMPIWRFWSKLGKHSEYNDSPHSANTINSCFDDLSTLKASKFNMGSKVLFCKYTPSISFWPLAAKNESTLGIPMKIGRRNRKWIAAGIAPTLLSVFAAILFAPQAGDGRMEQRWGEVFWGGLEMSLEIDGNCRLGGPNRDILRHLFVRDVQSAVGG